MAKICMAILYLRLMASGVPRIYVHSGVATLLVAEDGGPPLTLEATQRMAKMDGDVDGVPP